MHLTGRALVAAMCAGQVGNLLPHVVVPAIMAEHLIPLWGLSAAQAGLMAGAYAFGYMLAVPVLAALTDRIDARIVLLAGSALSGLGTAAFGLLADGLWSAAAICAIASRWVPCSATARTASSSTACAPGSWRSGPTSSRAMVMPCSQPLPSACSRHCSHCPPASSATKSRSASAAIAPSPS